jgi:hypothetical protein
VSDYVLWTKTGDGAWRAEDEADRPQLAALYYRARELIRTEACERAEVHSRGVDPNRQAPKASP